MSASSDGAPSCCVICKTTFNEPFLPCHLSGGKACWVCWHRQECILLMPLLNHQQMDVAIQFLQLSIAMMQSNVCQPHRVNVEMQYTSSGTGSETNPKAMSPKSKKAPPELKGPPPHSIDKAVQQTCGVRRIKEPPICDGGDTPIQGPPGKPIIKAPPKEAASPPPACAYDGWSAASWWGKGPKDWGKKYPEE